MRVVCILLVGVICSLSSCDAARILGIWPMEATSHYTLGNKLFRALALKGHEVTFISPIVDKNKVKNYREIQIKGIREELTAKMPQDSPMNLYELGQTNTLLQMYFTSFIGSSISEICLNHTTFQKFLADPNEKFDLIIMEMFYTEIFYGLTHKFNAPMIVLSTVGSTFWTNNLVANPGPNSYVPNLFTTFSGEMTLPQRMYNSFINIVNELYRNYVYFPELDKAMHKYFPDAPSLFNLMYEKTALVLLNSHPSISEPVPHVPAMKEIGGFHVEEPRPLPKDLKDFMDNAPNGVVLFSMGGNLKSSDLDDNKKSLILKAFSKLKQKVIWKFEDDNLPNKPSNLKIMKWCPQNDILAHPNLKLFITHGGLLSTTEAVYHGVPVVGIPVFGDQKMNVAMIKRKGFGVAIDFNDLTEENLSNAINEVLSQPKYKQAAVKVSQIIRDQPVQPRDAAVFWVEHILKHKGGEHLRSAAMKLSWCELYSVDIIGLIILADIIVFLVFYYICKKICGKKQSKKSVKESKKKN